MAGRVAAAGAALALAGVLVGVVYPWLLLSSSPERALEILRYTAAVAAIAVGAVLAAVGLALITGWAWRGSAGGE